VGHAVADRPAPTHTEEKTVEFINLTPHAVTVIRDGETILDVPPSGTVARLAEHKTAAGAMNDTLIPVMNVRLGEADGLPGNEPGTVLIVSLPMAMGLKAAGLDRMDVVYPFPQVRDDAGRIIGCGGFARLT
jgi:hypothetical protein